VGLGSQSLYDILVSAVTLLLAAYALFFLVRRLRRGRPELKIAAAVGAALAIRVLAAGAVSFTSFATQLRGSDEVAFKYQAHLLSQTPLGSGDWGNALTHEMQNVVMAAQMWLFNSPDFALRITMALIGVAGLTLIAASVYELAGPRAALICAWMLALEPSSIFFSTLLHKESLMAFAAGLVIYGGTAVWKRGDARSLFIIALGCLIGVSTRFYAGWFLIAAGAAICLHAGLRPGRRGSLTSLSLLATVVLLVAVAAPTVWNATSSSSLEALQVSQTANATDNSNLGLEEVDYSTRSAVISNLPHRVPEVLLKPYPWQLGNTSQQIGLIGTTVSYATLLLLVGALYKRRGRIMDVGAPLVYTAGFLFISYALSSGNAGTAFRYRVGVLSIVIALVVVLWLAPSRQVSPQSATVDERGDRRREPALAL
jgi:hypothetical protein